MKALFDTNILIDYLNGEIRAKDIINKYNKRLISPITWMEVLVGVDPVDAHIVESFLSGFTLVSIDKSVSKEAVVIRKTYSVKLPDAIIWASARTMDALLITRNTKDFPKAAVEVYCPYTLAERAACVRGGG